jgi:hypothetical protein
MPVDTEVIAIDNSAQGTHTVGDLLTAWRENGS